MRKEKRNKQQLTRWWAISESSESDKSAPRERERERESKRGRHQRRRKRRRRRRSASSSRSALPPVASHRSTRTDVELKRIATTVSCFLSLQPLAYWHQVSIVATVAIYKYYVCHLDTRIKTTNITTTATASATQHVQHVQQQPSVYDSVLHHLGISEIRPLQLILIHRNNKVSSRETFEYLIVVSCCTWFQN